MANGDAAAAAGMDVMDGTEDKRDGWDEINKTRDYVTDAANIRTGTISRPVSTTGVITTTGDISCIGVVNAGSGVAIGGTGRGFDPTGTVYANQCDVNGAIAVHGQSDLTGPVFNAYGRNNPVSSAWIAAALDSSGRLGVQPSARRFKKNITEWTDDPRLEAFLALRDVTYQLRAEIEGNANGPEQLGWIAEELAEAGFTEIVAYDTDEESAHYGEPISINYAQAVVPLHAIVKRQHAELAELRAQVAELLAWKNAS